MELKINLSNDVELRSFIKSLILSEFKSLIREEIISTINEVVIDKINSVIKEDKLKNQVEQLYQNSIDKIVAESMVRETSMYGIKTATEQIRVYIKQHVRDEVLICLSQLNKV